MTIGVVADDLTGGAAIAGEIARGGQAVTVAAWHQDVDLSGSVVIDTASRFASPDVSARRVDEVTRRLNGIDIVMKKIDSTLKGNVAPDLAAFARACRSRLIIAPACPEVGLGLRDGHQTTPRGPGRDVGAMLADVLPVPPALLGLETVRCGTDAVEAWLSRHTDDHVLADAVTRDDLTAVATGAARCGITSFAGTYGLGAALAGPADGSVRPIPIVNRLLVLAGSASPVTAGQVTRFGTTGARNIAFDPVAVLSGRGEAEARRVGRLVADSAPTAVVHTDPQRTSAAVTEITRRRGWSPRDLAERFAPVFTAAIEAAPGSAVLVIGGETTGAVVDAIGLHAYTVTDEVAPAVPLGMASRRMTSRPEVRLLLTKPGAFGDENTIVEVARRLLVG